MSDSSASARVKEPTELVERLSAEDRLAATREEMRKVMWARVNPRKRERSISTPLASGWLARLKSIPAVGVLADTVSTWWRRHPVRPFAAIATEAGRTLAAPTAQRHPLGLVLAAALTGAVFIKARAWRWVLKPAWFAGMVPLFGAAIIERMPLESWVGLFAGTGVESENAVVRAPADSRPSTQNS